MALDLSGSDLVVAVFGAGTMGRGIAQVCAQAGLTTLMFDSREGAVKDALAAIDRGLEGLVSKGRMAVSARQAVFERLKPIRSFDEAKGAGVAIEAIVEDLDAKRQLFRELEKRMAPDAVLATNTSSLSVTAIAAGCARPHRVGGLHFFNPPPLMRLVEVIGGLRSDPALVETLLGFVKRINKQPVLAADTPGFVVNHAGRAYGPEALRIVAQGIANPREVDLLMKEAAGFRMGPFELLDLVGSDVAHAVMVSIFEQYFGEPMYQPSAQMAARVAGGLLGRKSKQGFYNYDGPPAMDFPTVDVQAQTVPAYAWIAEEDGGRELAGWLKAAGIEVQLGGKPAGGVPCFVTPLGEDASNAAVRLGLDPACTVAVDMFGRFEGRRTLMKTPLTKADIVGAAVTALSAGNVPVTVINDSPGFVVQRLLAMIVNIGTRIAELRIATPSDIDTAVELGLNYPKGPLALGDALGVASVLAVLDGMHAITLDPKYRATTWLRRRARLGVSLRMPD
ncbi:MAG TPA: 3-hydroxyacyl-CoA dehydrogenase [Pseudolabrys sp.]|nr:3-hydroxyacyl-CoA dehydrogenase [Pseudolabrys sp.]